MSDLTKGAGRFAAANKHYLGQNCKRDKRPDERLSGTQQSY